MQGNTLDDFMNDLFNMGGPEKEFVFRDKFFFLETQYQQQEQTLELRLEEYDNRNTKDKVFLRYHRFPGQDLASCVEKFEKAPIFDGLTIYQAEQEIEVLFG